MRFAAPPNSPTTFTKREQGKRRKAYIEESRQKACGSRLPRPPHAPDGVASSLN
jgi:hypothetical protein